MDASNSPESLADIQASADSRRISIDKVGVRRVEYPIKVWDRDRKWQHTIGEFSLTVDLPEQFKGTHMSRFLEVLGELGHEINVEAIPTILDELRTRLKACRAHIEVTFPYFLERKAPVTGKSGMMPYRCGFFADMDGEFDLQVYVRAAVATLCPCSKEISDYGAHNQRGYVTVKVRMNEHLWFEDIIDAIESSASSPLYPVLKRPDEKFVTEAAYNNPRFVEDMVREVAVRFDNEPRISSYEIEVENEESIHAHNAYAYLAKVKS